MADNQQVSLSAADPAADPAAKPKSTAEAVAEFEAGVVAAQEAKHAAEDQTKQEAQQAQEKTLEERKAEHEAKLKSGDALVESLKTFMQNPTPKISTGFHILDMALGDGHKVSGGLPPGLISIGAIPSLGKTAFMLQLADNIAQAGNDVLFIALEMTAVELAARSISRLTARHLSDADLMQETKYLTALTSSGVKYFEKYTPENQAFSDTYEERKDRLQRAIEIYQKEIAPRLFIHEPFSTITASQIETLVKDHAEFHGKAPVVILDYIQLLASEPGCQRETDKQKMDAAALKLKHISRDYKTPVICISSVNRNNYNEEMTMESFKESGGIEYSCDTVLGMQIYGQGLRRSSNETLNFKYEKSRKPRRIQICVLKNRDGETGYFVNFENYPAVNLFKEVSDEQNEDKQKPSRTYEDVPARWKADPPEFKQLKAQKPNQSNTGSSGENETGEDQATDPNGIHSVPKKAQKPRKKIPAPEV